MSNLHNQDAPDSKEVTELYVAVRTALPGYEKEREKIYDAHLAWISRQRYEEGKLPMSGPFKDGSGGLMILNVSSLEEAIELSKTEPFVAAGIDKFEVKVWMCRIPNEQVRKNL